MGELATADSRLLSTLKTTFTVWDGIGWVDLAWEGCLEYYHVPVDHTDVVLNVIRFYSHQISTTLRSTNQEIIYYLSNYITGSHLG